MFFSTNNKATYIILGILVLITVAGYINEPSALISIVLTIPGVLIGITFHEFAHAFAADKLGDDTPRMQGRLTLNPLAHIDPWGLFLLIFAHIGWGKPVEINPRNFNRKRTMTQQEAIVSIAGPATNMILAIIFIIIEAIIVKYNPLIVTSEKGRLIVIMVEMAAIVNIGQGVFNLIPLPPLDGSKILSNFLSYNSRAWFEANQMMFYYLFIILWITGIAAKIISPIIGGIYYGLDWLIVEKLFGLF